MTSHSADTQLTALLSAFQQGDLRQLSKHYADDAAVVIGPGDWGAGRQHLVRAYRERLAQLGQADAIQKGDHVVVQSGDTALVLSKLYQAAAAPGREQRHNALMVLRKNQNGEWHCVIDNMFGVDLLDYV